jgi:hypothetical protein
MNFIKVFLGFLVLTPAVVFGAPPTTVYNETTYVAQCEPTSLNVLIYGDVGSDYENTGLELSCGDSFTLNDSFIPALYAWTEYSDAVNTVIVLDTTFTTLAGSAPTSGFSTAQSESLVLQQLADFSYYVYLIIMAVLVIALAYLIYKIGWYHVHKFINK